ncbi:Serpentine Receptor, class H [Caenorhabditis elegans]|uniref:Serpentine Receptor, class H n=1 Tax=Caenorhabditis elegans TaxID=6239 RepID=Q9GRY6_CAEEL|nr:Serpentine Receptor, class H [Caenorhabditis elegans]CAC14413.1 Serpentine Receptor, class H [Caenorhabditis elegans]|eukprot:NP_507522.1 Serpentine Receptor, class H [Caenorhabditis elegans]
MCLWRNSTYELDTFAPSVLHPIAMIEIPIHLLASYIVIFKTPPTMAKVKWMMMVMHFCGAFLDLLLSVLSTQYYLVPVVGGYMRGIFTDLGVSSIIQGHVFTVSLCVAGVSILGFFESRYHAVVKRNRESIFKSKRRLFYVMFHYVYGFTFTLPLLIHPPDQIEARKMAKEALPCVPHSIIDHTEFYVFVEEPYIFAIYYGITAAVLTSQAVYYFARTALYLSSNKAKSQRTHKLQVQFFIALTFQIAIPLCVVILPVAYIITAFITKHFDQIANNIALNFIAIHGLVSSTVMLIAHKPYREAVGNIFRLRCTWERCHRRPLNSISDQSLMVVSSVVVIRRVSRISSRI